MIENKTVTSSKAKVTTKNSNATSPISRSYEGKAKKANAFMAWLRDEETHKDGQISAKDAVVSFGKGLIECVKTIYSMEVPSSTEWNSFSKETTFIPNVFFDITQTINKKVDAMAIYASELREYPHPRSLQFIKELAKTNGIKVGLNYSENFLLVRSLNG